MKDKITALLKNEKAVKIFVLLGFAIIIIIFLSEIFNNSSKAEVQNDINTSDYINSLEERLEGILSEIDGVGEIHVMITMESSEESIYSAKEANITTTIMPKIRGVIVICDGAENIVIKQKVSEAISRVFGIGLTHISVIN